MNTYLTSSPSFHRTFKNHTEREREREEGWSRKTSFSVRYLSSCFTWIVETTTIPNTNPACFYRSKVIQMQAHLASLPVGRPIPRDPTAGTQSETLKEKNEASADRA
uniref:Uncharacterized protein n=1 Tax=Opuntia streptacantha TaxID=393608 RepID=A0A7C9DUQ6_OPUST